MAPKARPKVKAKAKAGARPMRARPKAAPRGARRGVLRRPGMRGDGGVAPTEWKPSGRREKRSPFAR